MSDEKFKVVIAFLQTALFVSGVVVVLINWGKSWQKTAAEKSVGAKKVKELEDTDTTIREDIRNLKENDEDFKGQIARLEKNYEKLIEHIWSLFDKK